MERSAPPLQGAPSLARFALMLVLLIAALNTVLWTTTTALALVAFLIR